jgi:predicted transcriptional regulator
MLHNYIHRGNSYCQMAEVLEGEIMNIKNQRKMAGRLSQIELAKRSGVSRFRISLAETGHIVLRAGELTAIVRALARQVQRLAKEFHSSSVPANRRTASITATTKRGLRELL